MTKMREQLMSRNVASEVTNDITASVQATLLNQKLKSFTRWARIIRGVPFCPRAMCRMCLLFERVSGFMKSNVFLFLVPRINVFRVTTAVQLALKAAVSRVLTPKKSTDVLREVREQWSPTPQLLLVTIKAVGSIQCRCTLGFSPNETSRS